MLVIKLGSAVLLATIVVASKAKADSFSDLLKSGYEIIWSGYSSFTTCVHEDDAYDFGNYLFVCDKFSYDYPYHYGDVHLVARVLVWQGHQTVTAYVCYDQEKDCVEGSLYQK